MVSKNRIPVKGSERIPLPGAQISGAIDPNERISVTVIVRRRKDIAPIARKISAGKPSERKYLTRDELEKAHGAASTDLDKVKEFAHEYGLDVVEANAAQRRVVLSGTVAALSAAFGVYLARYEHPKGAYRGRTGPVHVPEDIAPIVEGVFGLDNRTVARPHIRRADKKRGAAEPRAEGISYTPPQVAKLYDFPMDADGSGQCIGIIELDTPLTDDPTAVGAGYSPDDIKTYFSQLDIPVPTIEDQSVDGGQNLPGINPDADGEVALDIEVASAIAPGAKIIVYFAPNTEQGFLDAVNTAIHDTTNKPSVISISYGLPEETWSSQAIQNMDSAFQDAAALGVTVCCSAGDHGSSDGMDDGLLHADFPASSQYALACGGTRLEGTGNKIASETVWNDNDGWATGGGISRVFGIPSWQNTAKVPKSGDDGHIGRGVPDVAGDADRNTGYSVLLDGENDTIGGTSAVAPLWAGLIALLNQKLGTSVGYLNSVLYSVPRSTGAFHDIISGNNDITGSGFYQAGPGWNPCTGLGSPDGAKLLSALKR